MNCQIQANCNHPASPRLPLHPARFTSASPSQKKLVLRRMPLRRPRTVSALHDTHIDAVKILLTHESDVAVRARHTVRKCGRNAKQSAVGDRCDGANADPTVLVNQIEQADPKLFHDMCAVLTQVAPTRRMDLAFGLLDHPNAGIQLERADAVAEESAGLCCAKAMQPPMNAQHYAVRMHPIQALGRVGKSKTIPMLAEHAKCRANEQC